LNTQKPISTVGDARSRRFPFDSSARPFVRLKLAAPDARANAEEIPQVKKAADIAAARNTHAAQEALTLVPSYTSTFLKQSGISSENMREAALPHLPWGGPLSVAAAGIAK
jgi:hypothetical protein